MTVLPDMCVLVLIAQVASDASLITACAAPPGGSIGALLALMRVFVAALFRPAKVVLAHGLLLRLAHDCHATS